MERTPDTTENTPELSVGQIMREIQERVSATNPSLGRRFDELLAQTDTFVRPQDFGRLQETQGQANALYEQLRLRMPLSRGGPEGISFSDLASVPGASRPWSDPRRWLAAAYRLLFWRQEAFNREVVRRLQLSEKQSYFEHGFELVSRLLGTVNTLVERVVQGDQARAEWLVRLLGTLDEALVEIAARPSIASKLPGATAIGEPAAPQQLVQEISRLRGDLAQALEKWNGDIQAVAIRAANAERNAMKCAGAAEETREEISRRIKVVAAQPPPAIGQAIKLPDNLKRAEFNFLNFEGATRGDEAQIRAEQEKYVEYYRGAANVLDAGCGRGEFLELLRDAQIDAYGIDADLQMVEHCRAKSLKVSHGLLFEHLDSVPDESLGGIFLAQVIEHLPQDGLMVLPALIFRKLKPGGAVVMETINPMCLTTFSGAFYSDPTHYKPIHPKALEFLLGAAGFAEIDMVLSAPVPEQDKLAPLKENAPIEPVFKDLLLQANANLQRLNSVMYSFGNYALAARKPSGKA